MKLYLNTIKFREILTYLKQVDLKIAHPMSVLRTAISMLSLYDESAEIMDEKSNYLKAVKLQAQVGTLVAAYARIRKGLDVVEPRKDLSLAANFLYMLNDREPNEVEIEAFDKALVLHADHELNASTFTACLRSYTFRCIFWYYSSNRCIKRSSSRWGK